MILLLVAFTGEGTFPPRWALAQVRVVANPIAKLSLVGEYRYNNQEDDTSIVPSNRTGAVQYTNYRVHREVDFGRIEATYRFPYAIQGLAGWSFESIDRGSFTPTALYTGVSALREETDETTWYLQVRRNMTETVSGMLSYSSSKRHGSNWLAPSGSVGLVGVDPLAQLGSHAIYMPTLADRDRTKLRLLLTWSLLRPLQLPRVLAAPRGRRVAPAHGRPPPAAEGAAPVARGSGVPARQRRSVCARSAASRRWHPRPSARDQSNVLGRAAVRRAPGCRPANSRSTS